MTCHPPRCSSGRVEWYLHGHNSSLQPPESLLPPLVLADVTGDGVADLLVAGLTRPASHSRPPASRLSFVDGATGTLIRQVGGGLTGRIADVQRQKYMREQNYKGQMCV